MSQFEYKKFDGEDAFQPQSADKLFDQLSEYLMHYGDEVLDDLQSLEEENSEVLDKLIKQGYIEKDEKGQYRVTPKAMKRMETKSLEMLFDVRRQDSLGRHDTNFRGAGQTVHEETRPYEFGDQVSNLNMQETLRNALSRQAQEGKARTIPIAIQEDDLMVYDTQYQTRCATVILLDMSGSMSRYGKYGQAKKVALAIGALVRGKYQGDFLQTVGFYSYASPMTERELINSAPKPVSIYDPRVALTINLDSPPRFVPQHFTNIHAGLQFARRILNRQMAQNKQIIIITDGEPTAHLEGRNLRLLYPPADVTARATLVEAKKCADENIHVSSFALIEDYFYHDLANFVEKLAMVTGGISATCDAHNMGQMVIESFVAGRRKRTRM